MSRIMCTGRLWRRLAQCAIAPQAPPFFYELLLGSWSAEAFSCDGRELLLAVNKRTYLTVVFALTLLAQFRLDFSRALGHLLADLRLPEPVVRAESAAIKLATLGRSSDRSMNAKLKDIRFFAEIELSYHDDLRIVQWNLNQIPHPNLDPCVPIDFVRQLYEGDPPAESLIEH